MVEMAIDQLIRQGAQILRENNVDNPVLDSQLILANVLHVDKLYVMTNFNEIVTKGIEKKFINDIVKRSKGMPVQYIVGMQEFMSLNFKVNENVLIPRPDTEILVEEVIKYANKLSSCRILDIGTGSGCISISLAKYIVNAHVYTVDISEKALEIARHNAKQNGVDHKIEFFVGDSFKPFISRNEVFDIIVSNPPYIPTDDIEHLGVNVKDYEPRAALDGGKDGLDFYRRIITHANEFLTENGLVFFEIGYNQADEVIELFKLNSFDDISITKDLAGRNRAVKAVLSKHK